MVKYLLKKLIKRQHFWRDAGFDELTELYISSMLRTFALSLLMVFIPFYLYQHDYSIVSIMMFYSFFFAGKVVCDISASFFVARFGPKHSMIISCILQIATAGMFLTIPSFHWPVALIAPFFGAAASFFFIAYHVEFSKIKHTPHAGKEIGNMQIYEKIAAVIGPFVGGLAGSYLGGQYIFLVASVVMIASLVPLFRTAEAVKTRQHIRFADLEAKRIKHDIISYIGLGIENTLCMNLWPFYVALFALSGTVYASLGALSSVAVLISIVSAHIAGRIIDGANARRLFTWSVYANAFLYILRPFVATPLSALAVNVVNDAINPGYRMPFLKGMYAAADDLPGQRIVYIGSMECLGSITKGVAWAVLAISATILDIRQVCIFGFIIAAVTSFLMLQQRFKALGGTGGRGAV